jgi:CheY-like chemotaxis protein
MKILLVEDEVLVAILAEEMLLELGHEVAAVATRLEQAVQLATTGIFEMAMVDGNLNGSLSHPVMDALSARQIPFFVASGYGGENLFPNRQFVLVRKPFQLQELAEAIEITARGAGATKP